MMASEQTVAAIRQAAQQFDLGNFGAVEAILKPLAGGLAASNPDVLHLLALVCLQRGDAAGAVPLLERAITAAPRHPHLHLNLGKAQAMLGRPGQAIDAFRTAAKLKPDLVEALFELGNLQRREGRAEEAESSYRKLLRIAPDLAPGRLAFASLLLEGGRAEEAELVLARGVPPQDRRLAGAMAQQLALAQRSQRKHEAALENFTKAQALDPALSQLDFARSDMLQELHRYDEALAVLGGIVAREPLNEIAHSALNELLYRMGRDEEFLASYDRAPRATVLQLTKGGFLLAAKRGAEAHDVYAEVLARQPDNDIAIRGLAAALGQMERHGEAAALLDAALARRPDNPNLTRALATTALQARDAAKAAIMAEKTLAAAPDDQMMLALLGSAWRLLDDPRSEDLNRHDDLIRVFDLEPPEGFSDMAAFNEELALYLDAVHPRTREFINQTLRGGSQTPGQLFGAGHDLVDRLERRIRESVAAYIAALEDAPAHPFNRRRAAGFEFSQSWSSRLKDRGFHVNHVHPGGWISSCYYVAVPDAVADGGAQQGWIKFGEPPRELGLGLTARRTIQPRPGRLVLFPSYMWHGTLPFHSEQKRLTIAFDAVPRAQG